MIALGAWLLVPPTVAWAGFAVGALAILVGAAQLLRSVGRDLDNADPFDDEPTEELV